MSHPESSSAEGDPPDVLRVRCSACQSALDNPGRQAISFLLLDGLTIPVVGCEQHLDQFTTACGLTSTETATRLSHRPAGGISCPACQLSMHASGYPLVPVGEGAVLVLGCSRHQSEAVRRFSEGQETHRRLTTDFESIN